MREHSLDFYLVPSSDDHQNEYVPDCWQRRRFISGFSGSAGDVLIGLEGAWLWTDSRYWLQAADELDDRVFTLQRSGADGVPTIEAWLQQNAAGARVGTDPRVVSSAFARKLVALLEVGGGTLAAQELNLVDAIRPQPLGLPAGAASALELQFAGESVADKLGRIRSCLAERDCDALVLTALDAVAWSFNVRGRDVDFNPVLLAYGLIERDAARLFVDESKLDDDVREHLRSAGVGVEPYSSYSAALRGLAGSVWLDPATASAWVAEQVEQSAARAVREPSPVARMKSLKNATERDGMRAAHLRDGVALVRFLHWLQSAWQGGALDEYTASQRLDELRASGEHFRDLSFPTISGFGPNGAIVHYRVTPENAAKIGDSAPYLVDSGAQYLDGTTDVTRTVHLGTPRRIEQEHYTRVLRGHLALRHTLFPRGTSGAQLDAIARRPLWEAGLDYGHGTGHGVGCYLNVHERPPTIAPRATTGGLEPDMVVSNEPGLYQEGEYGIRIENLLLVREVASGFCEFEDLTLAPYARVLIARDLLSEQEVGHVDDYHARVRSALAPLLDEAARAWLEAETAPL